MAFKGWGVWSLVGQQLANAVLSSVFMWWSVSWRPSFQISSRHLNDLYHFSVKIAGNDLLWFFAQKSDQTMVGYGFGPLGLGPYSLASRLPTLLHDGLIGPLGSVPSPHFPSCNLTGKNSRLLFTSSVKFPISFLSRSSSGLRQLRHLLCQFCSVQNGWRPSRCWKFSLFMELPAVR